MWAARFGWGAGLRKALHGKVSGTEYSRQNGSGTVRLCPCFDKVKKVLDVWKKVF